MTKKIDENKIKSIVTRNTTEVVEKDSLEKKLKSGHKLRIKHGVDPTTSKLHLGYASIYHKLRDLQDLGHTIILLIGDFTARFGDPTGKGEARELRTKDQIMALVEDYKEQAGKVLDISEVEIRFNGEWYDGMTTDEFMRVLSHFTASRMMERDMFERRIKSGGAVFLHELLYPALQAYDSVVLQSDVTVIGQDQLFNEIQGRHIQKDFKQTPQDIIAMELMIGTDGKNKMSQSLGNTINILDDAEIKFGKIMSIPDELIMHYWMMGTKKPTEEIKKIEVALKSGELHPMRAKEDLAYEIVNFYDGKKNAESARSGFKDVFQKKTIPENINSVSLKLPNKLSDILIDNKLISSKSEFRRLIKSRGIEVNQKTISDPVFEINDSCTIRVGKLKFLKINKSN